MSWEDLAWKLTSRKFWVAVTGLVSGLLLAYKVDAQQVETICGVIMAGASVIAYIIGEGLVDGKADPTVNVVAPAMDSLGSYACTDDVFTDNPDPEE